MSLNKKLFLLCPIPEDQKPINEYIQIKNNLIDINIFFPKNTKNEKQKTIFFFFVFLFSIFFFKLNDFEERFTNVIVIPSIFLSGIAFVRFLRWFEINKRFLTARLFYEEGSWYDGEIWEKPFLLIKSDKLISSQKIQPIIQNFTYIFFSSLFVLLIFYFSENSRYYIIV
jgi:hypothetical protein